MFLYMFLNTEKKDFCYYSVIVFLFWSWINKGIFKFFYLTRTCSDFSLLGQQIKICLIKYITTRC